MSIDIAMNWGIAVILGAAGVALIRLCRAPRPVRVRQPGVTVWDSATDRWVRLAPGAQPGPGQLTARQIAELDQLELAWLAPAYDRFDLGAGLKRLRDAVRDEQQGGDTA